MSNRTIAKSYKVNDRDDTGVFVDLDFTCPHCDFENSKFILIGAKDFDKIDNDFETDQECQYCKKEIIVECR
jgi:rubredoxin